MAAKKQQQRHLAWLHRVDAAILGAGTGNDDGADQCRGDTGPLQQCRLETIHDTPQHGQHRVARRERGHERDGAEAEGLEQPAHAEAIGQPQQEAPLQLIPGGVPDRALRGSRRRPAEPPPSSMTRADMRKAPTFAAIMRARRSVTDQHKAAKNAEQHGKHRSGHPSHQNAHQSMPLGLPELQNTHADVSGTKTGRLGYAWPCNPCFEASHVPFRLRHVQDRHRTVEFPHGGADGGRPALPRHGGRSLPAAHRPPHRHAARLARLHRQGPRHRPRGDPGACRRAPQTMDPDRVDDVLRQMAERGRVDRGGPHGGLQPGARRGLRLRPGAQGPCQWHGVPHPR